MIVIAKSKLTEKQKKFCEEYVIDCNATQSAIRAGYKNAEIGRQLITKNNVSEYIEELRKKQSDKLNITSEMVLKGLFDIATKETARDSDKIKAFELLGKHLGTFDKRDDDSASLSKLDDVLAKIKGDL